MLNLNGTTTWSGNTGANNNTIQFWNGATINNNGTFNDANAFASFIEHNVGGPHVFTNLGTYNKLSNTVTTVDLGVGFNNSGTLNLNAGTMRFVSGTKARPAPCVWRAARRTSTTPRARWAILITAGTLGLADRTITVSATTTTPTSAAATRSTAAPTSPPAAPATASSPAATQPGALRRGRRQRQHHGRRR